MWELAKNAVKLFQHGLTFQKYDKYIQGAISIKKMTCSQLKRPAT